MDNEQLKNKRVSAWLIAGIIMILIMIAIGGITRLTHSGLSMVDWRPVMGSIPPLNEEDWVASFEKYKQFPEFKEINYTMTLEEYKTIFFWEYIHRLWARIMGLVFLFPFAFFWIKGYFKPALLRKVLGVLLGGAAVAGLGWFMVVSGLKDRPAVSHYRLAIHFMAASFLIAYIYSIVLHLRNPDRKQSGAKHAYVNIVLGVLLVQMIYGAFVAGLKAGLIHNTYPLMSGALIHQNVIALDPLYENFIQHKDGVQFLHRTIGLIFVVLVSALYIKKRKTIASKARNSFTWVFGLTWMQFLLGVGTLLLHVPISLGVIHQLVAVVLFLSVLRLRFFVRNTITEKSEFSSGLNCQPELDKTLLQDEQHSSVVRSDILHLK